MNQQQILSRMEVLRRELVKRVDLLPAMLRSPNFPAQNAAIDDRSKMRAWNCTRRAGKSVAVAIDFFEKGKRFPGSKMLYMSLTRQSAKNILWDIMVEMDYKHNIGCEINKTELSFTMPNHSRIMFYGVDASDKEMKKVLGQKLRDVAIDEAGSITINMRKLCYQMVRPALTDLNGQLTLLGTCENITKTFFEQVTEGKEPGWSVHKWTAYDNPFLREQWTKEIASLLANNANVVNTSWFKTHYLNQWCPSDELLIVKLTPQLNYVSVAPEVEWVGLGVDLGFNDDTSFVIGGPCKDTFYVLESIKSREMDFTEVATTIKTLQARYPLARMVIDGSNKQGVEELRRRHGLPFLAAEKTDKVVMLRIIKDECLMGKIKLVEASTQPLTDEWSSLQWKDEERKVEDPRCANHCSDAMLYLFRNSNHYTYAPSHVVDQNSIQFMQQKVLEEEQRHESRTEWWESTE
jgi:phage terminase large subunit